MDASIDAPSATTGATAEEEDVVADAGTTVAHASSGAAGLVRTDGKIILVRAPGETNLMRTALEATPASLRYRPHRRGTTTIIKTRGLGASKSLVPSPVSWVVLKPQPLSVSSSSLLMR